MARLLALWIGASISSKLVHSRLILVLFFGFVIALSGKSVLADGVCSERQFRCGNGNCIPLTWACEGEDDCGDNTDESAPQCKGWIISRNASEEIAGRNADPASDGRVDEDGKKWLQINPAPERHFLGGVLETPSALRMVGLIKNLPLNFVSTGDFLRPALGKREGKRRRRSGRKSSAEDGYGAMERPLLGRKEATTAPTAESGRKKRPVKSKQGATTGAPTDAPSSPGPSTLPASTNIPNYARPSPASCCKQQFVDGEDMSESQLRRETARMNLDVLRRLAGMLGEEQQKLTAERQMLSASRNMMLAETRKVMSERGKFESERQKVDLERDLLQSQILSRGRRFVGEYS